MTNFLGEILTICLGKLKRDYFYIIVFLLVRFTQGICGNDPLANYQCHHPSNHQQPSQKPYVKRTSKMKMMRKKKRKILRGGSQRCWDSLFLMGILRLMLSFFGVEKKMNYEWPTLTGDSWRLLEVWTKPKPNLRNYWNLEKESRCCGEIPRFVWGSCLINLEEKIWEHTKKRPGNPWLFPYRKWSTFYMSCLVEFPYLC